MDMAISDLEILELSKALNTVEEARDILGNFRPMVFDVQINIATLESRGKHAISKSLLPQDLNDWVPLISTPNGNCLFNSASILLRGDESLAGILRLLTVSELFAYAEFYANHPQLRAVSSCSGYSLPALWAIFLSNEKAELVYNGSVDNVPQAIKALAKETAIPFTYCSPFHVLALSSVLRKTIFSVYPDIATCVTIKKALHRKFYPREEFLTDGSDATFCKSSDFLPIMWTRTNTSPIRNWKPNHFVPLIPSTCTFTSQVVMQSSYANVLKNATVDGQSLPKHERQHDFIKPIKKRRKFTSNSASYFRQTPVFPVKNVTGKQPGSLDTLDVIMPATGLSSVSISNEDISSHNVMPSSGEAFSTETFICTDELGSSNFQVDEPLRRYSGEENPDVVVLPTSAHEYTPDQPPTTLPEELPSKNVNELSYKVHNTNGNVSNTNMQNHNKTSCEKRHVSYRPKLKRKKRKSTISVPAVDTKTLNKPKEKTAESERFCAYFTNVLPNAGEGVKNERKTTVGATPKRNEPEVKAEKLSEKETGRKVENETEKAIGQMTRMKKENGMENELKEKEDKEEILPLLGPNLQWYHEKGVNALTNMARTNERLKNSVLVVEGCMKGLVRGRATGTLAQNINTLLEKLVKAGSEKQQQHLKVMITLAKHMIENGQIVPTQELAKIYKEAKELKESSRIESSHLLDLMSKHLNVAQIYIGGKGFIIENHGKEVMKVLETVQSLEKCDEKIVREKVEEAIGNNYNTTMEYLDSKRDRDTLKAVLTKITSVNFMANLAKVQDKRAFTRSRDIVTKNIQLFEDIKTGLDEIDTTLTGEEKRRKKYRMLQKLKLETLRHVIKGRGRNLKSEEFPDLCGILEFAFGEGDRVDRAGGGLESHPRLTDTVLYRSSDNNTIMKNARETILALAPEGFDISLSSCFNYTQNYREGTYQAKRHHSGKGVNACISLHKPPRTGVEQFVINLHWSTHNVNLTLDYANQIPNNMLVDSRDAKAKIQADVSPVQRPGKSWRKIVIPDHDWSRETHNAITPMTHLFLETDLNLEEGGETDSFYTVRRTGGVATLLNLSYFEKETVHRVFNELFQLMINPGLEKYFRNPLTGRLKEHFVFIVDNGPSEAPSNPLVKMWLVRIARVLKLKSVTQKSFAEYHSKRNPVERVHAIHNRALSNELFSSKAVHEKYEVGDKKHLQNMEHMAEEINKCLSKTQYGGKQCLVMRGVGNDENFIFNDEENLVTFLGKTEGRKYEDLHEYRPEKSDLWREVATLWNLDENFTGSYSEDYQVLQNASEEEAERTCWSDKYSTTIINPDVEHELVDTRYLTIQPIPDYVRWCKTGGEMHYLSLETQQKLDSRIIDETPGAFLPSRILELTFKIFRNGLENVLPSICFLSWCTVDDVTKFNKDFVDKLDETFRIDKEREFWSQDEWYQHYDKSQLQNLCKKNGISAEGRKHECLKRLTEKLSRELPHALDNYDGILSSVPTLVTEIAKLSVYRLREILRFHNILDCGNKDELALKVGMLTSGRSYLTSYKELEAIKDVINATKTLVQKQKEIYLEDPTIIHKRRKFATAEGSTVCTSRPRDNASVAGKKIRTTLEVPENITFENIEDVFQPLESEIGIYEAKSKADENHFMYADNIELQSIRNIGVRVLVMWGKKDIAASGWKTGWYAGSVTSYSKQGDVVEIEFDTEKGVKYTYCVKEGVNSKTIKLAKSTKNRIKDYEEIREIGAVVEMRWEKDDLVGTDWKPGWYTAEVQSADFDDDEVDLVFVDEPECVYKIPVLPNLLSGILRLKQNVF